MLLKKAKNSKHTGRGDGGRRAGGAQETVVDSSKDRPASDGLVAGVAAFPADEVRHQHDDDEPGEGGSHDDGDQHVVFIQLALLS